MKSKHVYFDLNQESHPLLVRAAMMVIPGISPEMLRKLANMLDTLQAGGKIP